MVVRISGVNLPEHKRLAAALTSLYGVGEGLSRRILRQLHISPEVKVRDLTGAEGKQLRDYIETHVKVEGDLRREIAQHIRHLKDINSYRGQRHARHLPVRGQRTRTNSRTVRGNVRRTAGSGRKVAAAKT